jgi:hypothetical protein
MMSALIGLAVMFGMSPVEAKAWAWLTHEGREFEYVCAAEIIQAESSWRPQVVGDNGHSFGLAQRHGPAHGYPPQPWPVADQMEWFTDYADERYGGWCAAAEARRGKAWW